MKTVVSIILVVACFLGLAFSTPAVVSYVFTIIDHPGAGRTEAFGINAAGDIVGAFLPSAGGLHGFLYRDGNFTTIDVPGAGGTAAFGINSAGQIVGFFIDLTGTHGFLYSGGIFTTIDVPGSGIPGSGTVKLAATRAFGINAAGEIVGSFDATSPDQTITTTHGYLYSGGIFTIIDFPGAYFTEAFGINNAGEIVGSMSFPGVGGTSGFLYSRGTFTAINNPNSSSPPPNPGDNLVTVATGINDRGQIVGFFTDVGAYRGFVYERGSFTTIEPPGADTPNFALGINNAGHIVGYFNSATGEHGYLATPTRR